MKTNSKRNIADPISPQNPAIQKDVGDDRIQDELTDKTSVEEIYRPEKKDSVKKKNETKNKR
jgi:hypothetical protein